MLGRELDAQVHPYATLAYANTLAHAGRPYHVQEWQSYVIQRDCTPHAADATGPYPLTCIAPGSAIGEGLERLRLAGMVSVTLVVDDLVGPPRAALAATFPLVRPFKTHYLVDASSGPYQPTAHHRHEIRRAAQRGVEVRIVALPDVLESWTALYESLIVRHRITGIQRFTGVSFAALVQCRGLTTVAAFIGQEMVSCHLWFEHDGYVWSHLAVSSERGYLNGAAYLVYDHSIRHFAGQVVNLGGAAGTGDAAGDGLARFKAGFANRTHGALLCGAVLDQVTYDALSAERGTIMSEYFPAYRAPLRTNVLPHET